MKIEFTIAEEKDLEKIASIFASAIKKMDEQNIPQWDEVYPDKNIIEDDIRRKQLYMGMFENEIAVVYVLNNECDEQYNNGRWQHKDASYNVIHRMCVNPKFQNQGIGSLTLSYIEDQLKNRGIETIRLDTFSLNPFALKMYNKQGYKSIGEANWRKGKFYLMEKKL